MNASGPGAGEPTRSRGPRFLYFVSGPVIYRQELLALSPRGDLVVGHRELLHTGGLIVDRLAAAKEAEVPLDDQLALADWVNRSSTTEQYLLSQVLRDPERYVDCWVHVAPHECPVCRACDEAVRAELGGRSG